MKKCFAAVVTLLLIVLMAGSSYAMKAGSFEISPFVAVTERYSDNVFATKDNTKSDLSTVISSGVQLVFPRTKRRYHLELKYQTDIERFSRYSSENAVSHTASGKFDMTFPMGLELAVDDRFERSHDPRGETLSPELDFFNDNIFHASVAYSVTDRFKLRLDYSNDVLSYDNERNSFRNLTTNSFGLYAYYRFMPKISAFIEYEYVIAGFAESADLNSREQHFFGGVTWEVTGRTKGTVKAGYGTKDFDDASIEGYRGVIVDVTVSHNLTSRDLVNIAISRATQETNLLGDNFFVATALSAEYSHRLTGKITARAKLEYVRDRYSGSIPKTDDVWRGGLGVSYQFKRWLLTETGYSYTIRKSSVDEFDYRENAVFFRIVGTL